MKGGYLIVLTAVLASLLEIIDTSIVAVAVPRMQGNLGVSLDEITWVSTGYIISNAVVLPMASWLAGKIGRRPYFIGCIGLFTLASLACGLAPTFGFLVAARVIQGAAGGALLPTSQTLIQEQFPGKKSGIGSAIYGMSVMVGPALGPTLGGYLTDNYSWRSIFYINLPIGIITAILAYLFISAPQAGEAKKQEAKAKKSKIDWIGFLLLVAGIGCLQFVLERGQQDDWFSSNLILAATAVAGIGLPLFFMYEWRKDKPIVDVRLFKKSSIRSGTMLMATTGMVLYALVFLLPIYTDRQMGMDATHTGYQYIPGSLATMLMMPLVGFLLTRINPKMIIGMGSMLIIGCLLMLSSFTSTSGNSDIFWALMLRGLGLGCLFVPINSVVLQQFKGERLGQAAGLLNLFRQIGGSVGIAGMSTFLDRFGAQLRNDLRPAAGLGNPAAVEALQMGQGTVHSKFAIWQGLSPAASNLKQAAVSGLSSLQGRVEKQVFQLSFNRLMILVLVVYVFTFIPLFTLKLKKKAAAGAAMAALFLTFGTLWTHPAQADDAPLSLEDATHQAIEKSPDLDGTRAKADLAKWQRLESESGFLPSLTLGGHWYFLERTPLFEANFGNFHIDSLPPASPWVDGEISLKMPIFDGFRNVDRLSSAGKQSHAAELQVDWSTFNLRQQVRLAYAGVLEAKQLAVVAAQDVKDLEDHRRLIEDQVKAGVTTRVDLLRVGTQLSNAQSEKTNADDEVQIRLRVLHQMMGQEDARDAKDEKDVSGNLPEPTDAILKGIESAHLDSRADIDALGLQAEAATESHSAAAKWWFPTFSFIGNYDAYSSNQLKLTAYTLGLAMTLNIFDGLVSYSRSKEALESERIAERAQQSSRLQAETDFETYRRRYRYNLERYRARGDDVTRATESVRLARSGFRAGTQTNTDVLDAEQDLFNARSNLIQAQYGALESLVRFELALGKSVTP